MNCSSVSYVLDYMQYNKTNFFKWSLDTVIIIIFIIIIGVGIVSTMGLLIRVQQSDSLQDITKK